MLRFAVLFACAVIAAVSVGLFFATRQASALPEYSSLTGESCGVCHVNPGGGGPRTLRGLLWAARGKPVQLPPLPAILLAPEVQDAYELYGIACAGCHGPRGEGASGMSLTGTGISAPATRSFILNGIKNLGMPGFKGQLTDAQLDALVGLVVGLGSNKPPLLPDFYPLAPAQLYGTPAHQQGERQGN